MIFVFSSNQPPATAYYYFSKGKQQTHATTMTQPPLPYALEVSPDAALQFTITREPAPGGGGEAADAGSSRCVMTLTHTGLTSQHLAFKVRGAVDMRAEREFGRPPCDFSLSSHHSTDACPCFVGRGELEQGTLFCSMLNAINHISLRRGHSRGRFNLIMPCHCSPTLSRR